MQLAVLGGGESGVGAALLAKKRGMEVFVSDASSISDGHKQTLLAHGIPFEEGRHTLDKLTRARTIVKSPGIPNDLALLSELHKRALPILDEVEFAFRYVQGVVVAVTGSNGKSTTAHLIHHILTSAKRDAALVGNVGYSFSRSLAEGRCGHYVVELSSFQLENIVHFRPHVACLVSLSPDHLDRYGGSLDAYAEAKLRVLRNMGATDRFVYNGDDAWIRHYLTQRSIVPECYPIALSSNETALDLCGVGEALCLPGRHNRLNAEVAVAAARLTGVAPEEIRQALSTFRGLPHRLEWCGSPRGIPCYNDSKATNAAAAAVALESLSQPIVWIAGGKDKGNDYTTLRSAARKKVKAIVYLGRNNATVAAAFASLEVPKRETDGMTAAVAAAFDLAVPGDAILLSPACASFDLFENFEDRGDQFRAEIQKYSSEG